MSRFEVVADTLYTPWMVCGIAGSRNCTSNPRGISISLSERSLELSDTKLQMDAGGRTVYACDKTSP